MGVEGAGDASSAGREGDRDGDRDVEAVGAAAWQRQQQQQQGRPAAGDGWLRNRVDAGVDEDGSCAGTTRERDRARSSGCVLRA